MNSVINARRDLTGGACRHHGGASSVKSHVLCGFAFPTCLFVGMKRNDRFIISNAILPLNSNVFSNLAKYLETPDDKNRARVEK